MDKTGLTSEEARLRLYRHGPNKLKEKKDFSILKIVFNQFKSPLIYILVFAGLVSFFLQEYTDSLVIFLAVGVNTLLGFFQELKAEKSLAALKKILVFQAFVLRDGEEKKINVEEIVPEDLVVLKTGQKVPADGVLFSSQDLGIEEAILTGEAKPVNKKKGEPVFMGTVVVAGRGIFKVEKTGMETRIGQITKTLAQTADEETPLRKRLSTLSKFLSLLVGSICFLVFLSGLLRGEEFLKMFEFSVALAVAAIPEGLPIAVTLILTLGMLRLLKKKALIRKLLAAETLGSVSVICSDKTGTLTEGKMRVTNLDFVDRELGIKSMILCNNSTTLLEIGMNKWLEAKNLKGKAQNIRAEYPRIDEIPFTSAKKYIVTLHSAEQNEEKNLLLFSGAPEVVLAHCKLKAEEKEKQEAKINQWAGEGLRVTGFAYKKTENTKIVNSDLKDLVWLGILGFEDPVRKEVSPAFKTCQEAGIKIKIITGDYRPTAEAVIRQLDLYHGMLAEDEVLSGEELENLNQKELDAKIDKIILFYRTTPEQKIKIVTSLQDLGETVAMMGDGVNDALALKKADIGVVVNEASEVAKETSDMVLLDSSFSTIVAAVKEGRLIFENIKKVLTFLLSDTFSEVGLVAIVIFLGLPLPLEPVQILWLNLLEDGLPGLALAYEKEDGDDLVKNNGKNRKIFNWEMKMIIFFVSLLTDLLLLMIFYFSWSLGKNLSMTRSIIFLAMGIHTLFWAFSCRNLKKNLWQYNPFSNWFLNLAIFLALLLLFGAVYLSPLQQILKTEAVNIGWLMVIIGFGLVNLSFIEVTKWIFIKRDS